MATDEDEWGFPVEINNNNSATSSKDHAEDEEDDWGFPAEVAQSSAPAEKGTWAGNNDGTDIATIQSRLNDSTTGKTSSEEDEWGFPIEESAVVKDDVWFGDGGLSKDAASVPNKAPLTEEEWGFPTDDNQSDGSIQPSHQFQDLTLGTPPATDDRNEASEASGSLMDGWKTATRTNKLGTDLSTFTTILSNLDIPGPQHLLVSNLKHRAVQIGQGTQFTVFRDDFPASSGGKSVVIKRVRISRAALSSQKNLSENEQYRQTLRHLELEVLSLGILKHRNIVNLTGWGYDYEDRYTPIPILFMEAALAPLTDLLQAEKVGEGSLIGMGRKKWDIKYQLVLDVAAGLEAIHGLEITHGDIKPDNVLIFQQDNSEIPYVAKLSDFGVCINLSGGENITAESYTGTEAWTGPEVGVGKWNNSIFGLFDPPMLKHFDSYSFGMLLLAVFGTYGDPPKISKETGPNRAFILFGEVEDALRNVTGCPEEVIKQVKETTKKTLAGKPNDRPLPSPKLLQAEYRGYQKWLEVSVADTQKGSTVTQRGHSYWVTLDMNVLKSLDQQYTQQMDRKGKSAFTGETLFGIAEACSLQPIEDQHRKVLKYMLAAANKGHCPAQAVCAKVYEALKADLSLDAQVSQAWVISAARDGFMFDFNPLVDQDPHPSAIQAFRASGGYCSEPFLSQTRIISIAKDANRLKKWLDFNDYDTIIDSAGNTMMHICCALGFIDSLRLLLTSDRPSRPNENGREPIHLACQAGQTEVLKTMLLAQWHSYAKDPALPSPLHWLFMFPENDIRDVAERLVKGNTDDQGIDVNTMIRPVREYGRPQRYQIRHFPFELPHGTPFHWAAFAQNRTAMDVLLDLGADINAAYDNELHGTTALAQAVFVGNAPLVEYLLAKGASIAVNTKEGKNLLHAMSLGAGNENTLAGPRLNSWIRHGSWEKRLQASKDIVKMLVKAGVDMEEKAATYTNYTPVLTAATSVFRREDVVAALLDAGANTVPEGSGYEMSLLHLWCDMDPETLAYPHVHTLILKKIIEKTRDLNIKDGPLEETALHMLVVRRLPLEQMREYITLLVADPSHCVDVNARSRDGDTPLMKACRGWVTGMEDRLTCLLDHGAKPELLNDYQENFIHSVVQNYTLMDEESYRVIKLLFSHTSFTPEVVKDFVARTDLIALIDTCTSGRLKTLRYLLDLGFGERVNETAKVRQVETTCLDQAFFAATTARSLYIRYASELLTEDEIEEADRNNQLYTTNAGVRGTYGGPSPERAREAYWNFPQVLRLLQFHGAKRIQLNDRGPSWDDAVELPPLGMKKETQPHISHWQTLYNLDILSKDFEKDAWNEFKGNYEYLDQDDLDNVEVPVMVFERWPKVTKFLRKKEGYGEKVVKFLKRRKEGEEWYKGLLRDGRKVEVRMENGKIAALRDLKGKAVDIRSR